MLSLTDIFCQTPFSANLWITVAIVYVMYMIIICAAFSVKQVWCYSKCWIRFMSAFCFISVKLEKISYRINWQTNYIKAHHCWYFRHIQTCTFHHSSTEYFKPWWVHLVIVLWIHITNTNTVLLVAVPRMILKILIWSTSGKDFSIVGEEHSFSSVGFILIFLVLWSSESLLPLSSPE